MTSVSLRDISYLRSAVLGKVRIERMTQSELGALQLEHVAAVDLFEVPPTAPEHFFARPHHLQRRNAPRTRLNKSVHDNSAGNRYYIVQRDLQQHFGEVQTFEPGQFRNVPQHVELVEIAVGQDRERFQYFFHDWQQTWIDPGHVSA